MDWDFLKGIAVATIGVLGALVVTVLVLSVWYKIYSRNVMHIFFEDFF
jgi:hypothetical protein